jgi:hypothetical protein
MTIFHRIEHDSAGIASRTAADDRLSPGRSIAVIAVLSALSWAVLIAGIFGIRALL